MGNSSVYMGVNHASVLNPSGGPGRASVRITSKKAWTHELFILDLAHMLGTDCGSWLACELMKARWLTKGREIGGWQR